MISKTQTDHMLFLAHERSGNIGLPSGCETWADAFTIWTVAGETLAVLWYNDASGTTRAVIEPYRWYPEEQIRPVAKVGDHYEEIGR